MQTCLQWQTWRIDTRGGLCNAPLEDLLPHPLGGRPFAAANFQVPGTAPAPLDLHAPFAGARVGCDRHSHTDDPEFPQCRVRNSLDVGLIHAPPVGPGMEAEIVRES